MGKIVEDIERCKKSEIRRPSEIVVVGDVVVEDPAPQRARSQSIYSADLETAITETGCGKFNFALLVLSFFVSCTNGFDSGSMSYVIPAASVDLDLSPSERALLQSACYGGMILAGIIWGFMSDAFGRKKLLVIGFFLDALMNLLAGAFPILPLMVVFKFLAGFMICGPFPIFTAYLSEVYPKKGRDIAILSMGFYSSVGSILQAGLAMLIIPTQVPSEIPFRSWQIFQMACCLPSLISGIGCLFFVESPKFLADKGNHKGALKVCQTIYSINTGKQSANYPIKRLKHIAEEKTEKKSNLSLMLEGLDIFKPPYLLNALIIFSIYFGAAGSYNMLRLWLPEMLTLVDSSTLNPEEGLCPLLQEGNLGRNNLTSENVRGEQVFSKMMLVNSGGLVGQLILMFAVGYVEKKTIILNAIVAGSACLSVIPFISADYVFIVVSIFMTLYDVCLVSIINMVVEIFPTRIRATSISVLVVISRIGTLSLNFLMTTLIYGYCEYVFYGMPLCGLVIAGLIIIIPKKPIEDNRSPSK